MGQRQTPPRNDDDDDLPGETTPSKKSKKPAANLTAEPPDEPEPTPPPKQQHSSNTRRVAAQFGFSDADLDVLTTEQVWTEIHQLQRLNLERAKHQQQQAVPTKDDKRQPVEEVDEDEEFLKNLEADAEFDQRYTKFFRRLRAGVKAPAVPKELADKVAAMEKAEVARQERANMEAIDAGFAALPKKFHVLVGTGSLLETTDPGERGWRGSIFQEAKINFTTDTQRTINSKILAAATKLAGHRVKDEPDEPERTGYDAVVPSKRSTQARQQPRDESQRFTVDDFNNGQTARPGKHPDVAALNGPEVLRQHLLANGDPRGARSANSDDDSDLPE